MIFVNLVRFRKRPKKAKRRPAEEIAANRAKQLAQIRERDELVKRLLSEGRFTVNSDGEVFSAGRGRRVGFVDPQGYRRVSLYVSGGIGSTVFLEHRIVWLGLFGDIPEGMQINHMDGVKSNNKPSNLELVNASENQLHAYRIGLSPLQYGDNARVKKHTEAQVREIRRRHGNGERICNLARAYGSTSSAIYKIVRGKSFKKC